MSEKPPVRNTPATQAEIQATLAEGLRDGTFRNLRANPLYNIYEIDGSQQQNVNALQLAVSRALDGLDRNSKPYKKAQALAAQIQRYKSQWMASVQAESSDLFDEATTLSGEVDGAVNELEGLSAQLSLMLNRVTGRARLN